MWVFGVLGGGGGASDNCKTTLVRREQKLHKNQPEPAFGWVLVGWVLGGSLDSCAPFLEKISCVAAEGTPPDSPPTPLKVAFALLKMKRGVPERGVSGRKLPGARWKGDKGKRKRDWQNPVSRNFLGV